MQFVEMFVLYKNGNTHEKSTAERPSNTTFFSQNIKTVPLVLLSCREVELGFTHQFLSMAQNFGLQSTLKFYGTQKSTFTQEFLAPLADQGQVTNSSTGGGSMETKQ